MNNNDLESLNGTQTDKAAAMDKYQQALSKYNCNISDADVAEAVRKIITEKVLERNRRLVCMERHCTGCTDHEH